MGEERRPRPTVPAYANRLCASIEAGIAGADAGDTMDTDDLDVWLTDRRAVARGDGSRYTSSMAALTARLQEGRFILNTHGVDEDLPPLTLVIEDPGDDLDDEERAALEALIEESFEASARGDSRQASALLAELQARSSR